MTEFNQLRTKEKSQNLKFVSLIRRFISNQLYYSFNSREYDNKQQILLLNSQNPILFTIKTNT